jgi:hypothetical protein
VWGTVSKLRTCCSGEEVVHYGPYGPLGRRYTKVYIIYSGYSYCKDIKRHELTSLDIHYNFKKEASFHSVEMLHFVFDGELLPHSDISMLTAMDLGSNINSALNDNHHMGANYSHSCAPTAKVYV